MNDSDSTLFATKDIRSGFVGVENKFPASVFCPPSCWLLNKSLVDSEYFDEEIHVIEDCDYFARIVRKYPAYFLNEPLVKKYTHTNLAGGVPIEFSENTRERMLSKWLTEMKKDKKYLVDFYCTMSKDLMRLGNKKKSLKALIKALKIDIFNPKIIGKVFKVIFS